MRPSLVTPLLLAALFVAPEAAAQSSPSGAEAAIAMTAAKALFEEGQSLLAAGRFPEAKAKLEASIRHDPSPAARLALGACHEQLGATASAWGEYQSAAREARLRGDPASLQTANERAKAIEPKLSKVKVVVTAPAPDIKVVLDGRDELPSSLWGPPLPVDPGWHKLEATAPGRKKLTTAFQVRTGEALTEVVIPALAPPDPPKPAVTVPAPATPPKPPSSPSSRGGNVAGIVLISLGLAGMGAGLGIACIGLGCYPGDRAEKLSSAAVAGGLTAGLTGIGLMILGFSAVMNAGNKKVVSIRLHPVAFATGAGLGLHATW